MRSNKRGLIWKGILLAACVAVVCFIWKVESLKAEARYQNQFFIIMQEMQVSVDKFMEQAALIFKEPVTMTEQEMGLQYAALIKGRMEAVDVAITKLQAVKAPRNLRRLKMTSLAMLEQTNAVNRPIHDAALEGEMDEVFRLGDEIETKLAPMIKPYFAELQRIGIPVPAGTAEHLADEALDKRDSYFKQNTSP